MVLGPTCFGIQYGSTVSSPKYNKMLMKKKFKEHNTYVLEVGIRRITSM